ncbi:MAG: hypothetical protein RL417_613, partial [Pseudomonadota bacterium]
MRITGMIEVQDLRKRYGTFQAL